MVAHKQLQLPTVVALEEGPGWNTKTSEKEPTVTTKVRDLMTKMTKTTKTT